MFLLFFSFFFIFCKQAAYALGNLELEPLESIEETKQEEVKSENATDFQVESFSVGRSPEQETSKKRLQTQNLISSNNSSESSDENWVFKKISAVGRDMSFLYENVRSDWNSHLERRREEAIYRRETSIENLASKIQIYTEITEPNINDHIRMDIERWINLSLIDRNELRYQKQGIVDEYGLSSLIPLHMREGVMEIENQDTLQSIHNWSNLTYEQRRGLRYRGEDIRYYYDVSSLSQDIQNLITETEASDEQSKIELENQWARLRARVTSSERFTENPEMEEYQFLGIKLFPIHRRDYVYPVTRRNNMELFLIGQSMKLEIHSSTNLINYEILAENVQEVQLIMACPDQPDCKDNIIKFNSGGYWYEYSLDQLVDRQNISSIRYLKIVSSQSNAITDVGWESVMKSYRGTFRIQFARQTRTSELFEWSFINDLHIEEYIRSVVPSEFPVSVSIDAVKAQAIAARTFALNHVIRAQTIESRKWDVTPTTQFQLYLGIEEEHPRSDRAIEETRGIVLAYRGRLALTEYFSCTENATDDDDSNPVASSRNIPSYIICEDYNHISQNGGHGRGMPQMAAKELATEGWLSHADNLPTENAVVPENFDKPWNYRDILLYFYNNVSLYHYTNIRLR